MEQQELLETLDPETAHLITSTLRRLSEDGSQTLPTVDELLAQLTAVTAAAPVHNLFANDCHDPQDGRFCESAVGTATADLDQIKHNQRATLKVKDALDAIANAHAIPKNLPQVRAKIEETGMGTAEGIYNPDTATVHMVPDSSFARGVFIHEFGHHLTLVNGGLVYPEDSTARFAEKNASHFRRQASRSGLGPVLIVIALSQASTRLKTLKQNTDNPFTRKYAQYLLDPREQFARAYTQWVVGKSKNHHLRTEFDATRFKGDAYSVQWTDTDFEPIATAFDKYFAEQGLTAAATFANPCHAPDSGRFCSYSGSGGTFSPDLPRAKRGFSVQVGDATTTTDISRSTLQKAADQLAEQMAVEFGGMETPKIVFYTDAESYGAGLLEARRREAEAKGGDSPAALTEFPDASAAGKEVHVAPWVTRNLTEITADGIPEYPQEWRKLAHEVAHTFSGHSEARVKYNTGLQAIVEEGAAEILSLKYATEKFGPTLKDTEWNAVYTEDGDSTVRGNAALIRQHVYPERVAEVLAQAIRRNGWDRSAVLKDIERTFAGTTEDRNAFFDAVKDKQTVRFWPQNEQGWEQLLSSAPEQLPTIRFRESDDPVFDTSRSRAASLLTWLTEPDRQLAASAATGTDYVNHLRTKAIVALAALTATLPIKLANDCHSKEDGRFCSAVGLSGDAPAVPTASLRSRILNTDRFQGFMGEAFDNALAAIEQVHQVPSDMSRIRIFTATHEDMGTTFGNYVPVSEIPEINVSEHGNHLEMTTVHEFGHFLDHKAQLLWDSPWATSRTGDPKMKALKDAIKQTKEFKVLKGINYNPDDNEERERTAYFLADKELFARAYVQWIATRSGNARLDTQISRIRNAKSSDVIWGNSQWSAESFVPIAAALDDIFAHRGLLNTPQEEEAQRLAASAATDEFMNTCHSPQDGRFCEKHGVTHLKGSAAEIKASKAKAKAKIERAPKPSRAKVLKVRAQVARARAEGKRPGGENRGNSTDRRNRQKALFNEWGGNEKGYIVCPVTGHRMHWSADPKENPNRYPEFSQDKIWVSHQGGTYTLANTLPVLKSANQARGDRPLREGNMS